MDQQNFKVIFTGKLKQGTDIKAVAAAFAIKCKQTPEKALKILQANKELTLIKKAEHVKAYKFKAALEELGLIIRLERAAIVAAKPIEKKPELLEQEKQQNAEEQQTSEQNSYSLTMDSIEPKQETETKTKKHSHINTTPIPQTQLPREKPKPKEKAIEKPSLLSDFFSAIKQVGGWIAGGLAFILVIVKKFGLFKIGGLITAAAFAGYNPEEMCMSNDRCEDAVDEQIDVCWDIYNLDDYDWDNMSQEDYMLIKPKLEKDFIGCFVYEDTNERVFLSPLEIRIDLMDNCDITGKKDCIERVEPQIKTCYDANNIGNHVSEDTVDYYQAVQENQKDFKDYYACFLDERGEKIFQPILDDWSYYYLDEY